MHLLTRLLPVLCAPAIVVALAGCSGKRSGSSTPLPATPPVQATSLPELQNIDLAEQPEVKEFVQKTGGEVVVEEIIYADLTGDGLDDAVVPVSSGGTQGDLAFIVIGYLDGTLKALFSDAPAGGEVRVNVKNRQLVESLPVYSVGDQPHFPSKVKNIYYVWKGDTFVEDHEEVVPGQFPPA